MKFQCDRCKTRYSIGDEKIKGKVLKIRCKNCSAVISVRESGAQTAEKGSSVSPAPTAAAPSAGANGTAKRAAVASAPAPSPVLEQAFERAMSRLPTPGPLQGGLGDDDDGDDDGDDDRGAVGRGAETGDGDSTRLVPTPVPGFDGNDGAAAPSLEVEWFVSVDGNQDGPFSLAEARDRVGHKQPDDEMFAWTEGFDDWLPIEEIPDLAAFLPRPAPRARPTAPPIPADAGRSGARAAMPLTSAPTANTAPATALGEAPGADLDEGPLSLAALAKGGDPAPSADDGGNMDFEIGEASRVVKLPMLIPGGATSGNAAGRPSGARSALPGVSSSGLAARGSGNMPAVGVVLPADANPAAAVLQPQRKGGHGLLYLIAGLALLAIVGVLVVFVALGKSDDDGGGESGATASNSFVEGFYNESTFGVIPGMVKRNDPSVPVDPKDPSKGMRPGGFRPRPPGTSGTVTSQNPGGTGRTPGEDITDPTLTGIGDRNADEVLEARQRYGGALQQCWERTLKINPDLKGKGVRLEVNLTITSLGRVQGVLVNGQTDKDLKECVRQRVTSWGFKQARADFSTQFTMVFN